MSNDIKIENASTESAELNIERGLTAWINVTMGGCSQGFGGFRLYAPSAWVSSSDKSNYAGHFIYRCLQIAGVEDWSKLVGKCIRIKHDWGKIHAIGHIIKDDWFDPSIDFEEAQSK